MYSDYMVKRAIGSEKTCPVCKKRFLVPDPKVYAYRVKCKTNNLYVCSWSCLRKYEEKHDGKRLMRQKYKIQRELKGLSEGCYDGDK